MSASCNACNEGKNGGKIVMKLTKRNQKIIIIIIVKFTATQIPSQVNLTYS